MEETETVLTLADFGALLRERRIHKGLTEENVAAELKITSRLVKAIEEGDMESMPHAVYARGFIRAYAKLLAVDDSVTHAACALLKDPEEELREQEIRVVPAAARREESHVPWLAILLCALFLAGGAWYFRDSIPGLSSNTVSREKTASPAVSSPAVPEADTVVTTPAIPVEPAANATLASWRESAYLAKKLSHREHSKDVFHWAERILRNIPSEEIFLCAQCCKNKAGNVSVPEPEYQGA